MKFSKIIALLLVMALSLMIAACGGSKESVKQEKQEKKVVIHVGATVATSHGWYKASEMIAKEVKEKSNGSLELVLDFGGVLGGGKEIAEAVRNGSLGMAVDGDIGFAQIVPEIGYVNLPYVFPTIADVDKNYYNGWIGEAVKASMKKNGMEILGYTDSDFRYMTNSKIPIQKPEDLKNLKLRVPPNPMYVEFFKLIGTLPTAMGITEVASALQQKVIDGQDNGPNITYSFGFHQFQPYMTRTNHAFVGAAWFIGTKTINSLSPNQQKILRDAVAKYAPECTKMMRADVKKLEEEMSAKTKIVNNTPELDKFFREAAKKVWHNSEITKTFDQEAIKKLLAQ